MIQKEEPRAGNLIYGPLNRIGTVVEITVNGASCTLTTPHSLFKYEDINGIPLTDEWLITQGGQIEEHFRRRTVRIGDIVLNEADDGWYVLIENGYDELLSSKPISFIHQLQNLYFALTGTELEIK